MRALRRCLGRASVALAVSFALAGPLAAQGLAAGTGVPLSMGQQVGVPRAPLLTIDRDRLFSESAYGRRLQEDLVTASRALATENRAIEAELAAREQELTDLRPTLPFEEFRTLADAFDARVTRLRNEQDAKARALQRRRDLERQTFFADALPVLSQIVREAGATAILDRSSVFIAADEIDITSVAIQRLDRSLGSGPSPSEESSDPAPSDAPEAAAD